MTDAEQQHLPVQLIDAPHRAVDAVRDLDRVRGGDAGGLGAGGGKGMRAVAAQDARYAPESIGHHAHFFDARGGTRVKGVFIVPRHAGHDQRALRPRVAWSAAISPAGPPSTGLTFEKAQWTSSTPPGCTPRA